MIISSAPSRMEASCALGNPLCCLAKGKMVYISRRRSRSVRTAPLTRATGLSLACAGAAAEAAGGARTGGAGEATWAVGGGAGASTMQMENLYFIIPRLLLVPSASSFTSRHLVMTQKKRGGKSSPWG